MDRVVFADDRQDLGSTLCGSGSHYLTRHHQRLFVRKGYSFPSLDRTKSRYKSNRSDSSRDHNFRIGVSRNGNQAIVSAQYIMAVPAQQERQFFGMFFGIDRYKLRFESCDLLGKFLNVSPGSHRNDSKAAKMLDHFEGIAAD